MYQLPEWTGQKSHSLPACSRFRPSSTWLPILSGHSIMALLYTATLQAPVARPRPWVRAGPCVVECLSLLDVCPHCSSRAPFSPCGSSSSLPSVLATSTAHGGPPWHLLLPWAGGSVQKGMWALSLLTPQLTPHCSLPTLCRGLTRTPVVTSCPRDPAGASRGGW